MGQADEEFAQPAGLVTVDQPEHEAPHDTHGDDGHGDHRRRKPQHSAKGGKRGRHWNPIVEWVVIVAVALTAALLIKAFAVQAFYIPSQSMQPTLYPGDRVLVNKLSYDLHPVHTGDIVVFSRPPADTSATVDDLIKRVVALPGQMISVHNCAIYINGKELRQPYLPRGWQQPSSEYCTTWVDGSGTANLPNPYKVPAGDYFVMGDNRTDSDDSRYWGPLPGRYIVGRAFLKMWPPSHLGFL